ncbi:MAG: EamA family transporter [Cyanobacteria bacterium P01_D01_bin.105]
MNSSLKRPPATALVLIAILSVQFGSALAKSLFTDLGPWGVVTLRVTFSAILLSSFLRLKWNDQIRQNATLILAFGSTFALMNSCFYLAIDRIPLGIAIAIEFTGPLGLSMLNAQRWLDGLWILLAAIGIVLLTPLTGATIDPLGILFAFIAGIGWALYITCSAKLGQKLSGIEGLAWGLLVSTGILLPIGIVTTGPALLNPTLLLLGLGVALLSTTLPYSLEMIALRSMPINVFGVMMSMEPMAGALAGLIVLGETLSARSLLACLLVSIAAAGAARYPKA